MRVAAIAISLLAACAPPPERAVSSTVTAAGAAGWRAQVIYLAIPDRFRNGDAGNDGAGAPGCLNPADPHAFHGGDLEGLRQGLPYLRSLGATALWVTPLNRQIQRLPNGNCGYHGYWADRVAPDDGAVEPRLGTPQDLEALAGALHASGMRFILDMVVNHTGDTARLPREQPSWFHDPRACSSILDCPLDAHPDFAQEKPEVAAYLSGAAAGWVSRFGIDGIRMDTAKYVAPSYFHDSFFPAVRAANPSLFSVAEIFDTGPVTPFVPYLDAGFDSAFHFELRAALVSGIAHGGSIDDVARAVADGIQRLGMERALDLVLFLDNHDVRRFVNEPGWGVPEDEIRRRTLLALDLVFTLPGIPQLYFGDELGVYGGGDPDNRRDLPAWATDAAARAQPHPGQAVAGSDRIFQRVQRLAALRTGTPALTDGAYRELWRQNGAQHPNVLAFARGSGAGARIVVVSNGSARSGTMHIPVPPEIAAEGTQLVDELDDGAPAAPRITGGQLVVDLPGRAAAIYHTCP